MIRWANVVAKLQSGLMYSQLQTSNTNKVERLGSEHEWLAFAARGDVT